MHALLDRDTIEQAVDAAGDGKIVVALSGGGDSTALLHLLTEELGASKLRACVVNHALREEASAEAKRAASFAASLGVCVEIVTLHWDQPGQRAQEETRAARYRALCEEARAIGSHVIALGHTRDDQAETVFLRATAGSGWRGLAGMRAIAPAPLWPEGRGIVLARPLLRARRAALRAALRTRGADWIEDPSNANDAFARVRTRTRLATLTTSGFDPMRLAALAERLRLQADALDADAARHIRDAAAFEDDTVTIARARWRGAAAVRQRALGVLLLAASGESREAPADQVEALEARFADSAFTGATLGGALVKANASRIALTRDRGALLGRADGRKATPPLPLQAGEEIVWDGRLALTAREAGWSIGVNPMAQPHLFRGEETRALGEEAAGIASFRWILEDRAAHLLDAGSRLKAPVFTG